MARMLPTEVGRDNPSRAEKKLFGVFRDQLPGDWTVLHSLGLARHRRKRWAEADFVLVGPRGVFVGEVKGGRVRRDERGWVFTSRHGHENSKLEGPYDQAGSCAGALNAYLGQPDRRNRIGTRVQVGWAVMFPDISFRIEAPDIDLDLTYDEQDTRRPISRFVDRIADHWDGRNGEQSLSRAQCEELVRLLRPDFDLRPSLKRRADLVEEDLVALTASQYRLVDGLAEADRVVVRGGAGTGKTMFAIDEAFRYARSGKTVFLTCYTKALGTWMAELVGDEEKITAQSFHAYLHRIVSDRDRLYEIPPEASDDDRMELFLPRIACDAIIESEDLLEAFDVLIIDEAQDLLLDTYREAFDALLAGGLSDGCWRMFLDPNQNLFTGMNRDVVDELRRTANFTPYILSENCRNTAKIATFAAQGAGLRTDKVETPGPDVEKSFCRDSEEMRRKASRYIKRLLSEGIPCQDIVVLSPRVLERSCLASGLEEDVPATLEDRGGSTRSDRTIDYATVGSFKGLERPFVVLVDIDELEGGPGRLNLYVGATRARVQLGAFLDSRLEETWSDAVQQHVERMWEDEQLDG
jgi:hypothetical protein